MGGGASPSPRSAAFVSVRERRGVEGAGAGRGDASGLRPSLSAAFALVTAGLGT